jgi:hypothetical protein
MKRKMFSVLVAIASILLLNSNIIYAVEENTASYTEEEKQACEQTGGSWVKEEIEMDSDYPKSGENVQEYWVCECPEGKELGMGACYEPLEDELENMMGVDQDTCELGDGIWIEPNVSGGSEPRIEEDNVNSTEDDYEMGDDESVSSSNGSEDLAEVEGYCRCREGEYWSKSEDQCVEYTKEYLCNKTAGRWNSDSKTCECLFSDSTWEEDFGCVPPVRALEEPSQGTDIVSDNEEKQEVDKTDPIEIDSKFGYVELGVAIGVSLFLGTGIGFAVREFLYRKSS